MECGGDAHPMLGVARFHHVSGFRPYLCSVSPKTWKSQRPSAVGRAPLSVSPARPNLACRLSVPGRDSVLDISRTIHDWNAAFWYRLPTWDVLCVDFY